MFVDTIRAIARDIAALKRSYPQLAEFDPERNTSAIGLRISYAHETHRSTVRGGWRAAVPSRDPDGIWFYIDFHDAHSMSQINTQTYTGNLMFRDKKVSLLVLEGRKTKSLRPALSEILKRHGALEPTP